MQEVNKDTMETTEEQEVKTTKQKPQKQDKALDTEYNISLFLERDIDNEYYSAVNEIHKTKPTFNTKDLTIVLDSFERIKVKVDKDSEVYQYLKSSTIIQTYSLLKFKYNLDVSLMENPNQWYLIISNNSKARIQLTNNTLLAKCFITN